MYHDYKYNNGYSLASGFKILNPQFLLICMCCYVFSLLTKSSVKIPKVQKSRGQSEAAL